MGKTKEIRLIHSLFFIFRLETKLMFVCGFVVEKTAPNLQSQKTVRWSKTGFIRR